MKLLYTSWCAFWFIFLFLLLFPFQFICLQRSEWKPMAHRLNRVWGQGLLFMIGIQCEVLYRFKPEPKGVYVFCANHFSYFDIAVMGVILNNYFAFVGKQEAAEVPLFGYLFKKLYISVNRERAQSRVQTLSRAMKCLVAGRSIMIFPEGGIRTKQPPQMYAPFMDGAFQMAIQTQTPIVPISLTTNYKIMPDAQPLRVHRQRMKAVIHEPISTKHLTQANIAALKQQCFDVIQNELSQNH